MALRLIEVFVPAHRGEHIEDELTGHDLLGVWREPFSDGRVLIKILLETDHTEAVLEILERHFGGSAECRIIILPVEASVPRPKPKTEEPAPGSKRTRRVGRISGAELYAKASEGIRGSWLFMVMVVLSTFVAAVGLYDDNVAVIIGAMVIAPLLAPNVALALATTLGDVHLARRAFVVGAAGLVLALAISIVIGALNPASTSVGEIQARTTVDLVDVALALASGVAGALSFTTAVSSALVGVMVAVALMPPLVVAGLMIGTGQPVQAVGAAGLLLTNLVCVNLSGVGTFLLLGVRPPKFWQAERAFRNSIKVLLMWATVLVALLLVIVIGR